MHTCTIQECSIRYLDSACWLVSVSWMDFWFGILRAGNVVHNKSKCAAVMVQLCANLIWAVKVIASASQMKHGGSPHVDHVFLFFWSVPCQVIKQSGVSVAAPFCPRGNT